MILITGGAGFIGSNLVAHYCAQGVDVTVCDWLGSDDIKWRNLAHHTIDRIIRPEALPEFLETHGSALTAVIHMGAISATTARDGDKVVAYNFDLSRSLWEFCTQQKIPFIYASSAATYGDGGLGFKDSNRLEHHERLRPLNLYGWSKKWFDVWVLKTIKDGNPSPPQWAGLKFFNVYGPNEYHKDDMMSLLAKTYKACAKGEDVKLFKSHHPDYKDGGQLRDFVYVDDCVSVIDWMLTSRAPSGIFNVGSGTARSFYDLIAASFKAYDQPVKISYRDMPEELRGKYQYYTKADLSGLRQAGYHKPTISLEEGVRRYVQDFLTQEDPHR